MPATKPINLTAEKAKLIEEFQCPGCGIGGDTSCGNCVVQDQIDGSFYCKSHAPGTFTMGAKLFLGMPVGFNKYVDTESTRIRIYPKGTTPSWNELNLPVWASEIEGRTFVRTLLPRKMCMYIDVLDFKMKVPEFKLPIDPTTLDID